MTDFIVTRSTTTKTYGNLWLYQSLTSAFYSKIDPYWYQVKANGLSHRQFVRRDSLTDWLKYRGLSLTVPLIDEGFYTTQRLKGTYQTIMHKNINEFDNLPDVIRITKVISKGQYTLAKITKFNNIFQVHFVSPDIKRKIFDYDDANETMG